jgi:hypothetical protein
VTDVDTMTGLAVIEGIDLHAEIPCEDIPHMRGRLTHPADFIGRFNCPECPRTSLRAYCWDAWEEGNRHGWECVACKAEGDEMRDVLTIVQVLR